MGIFELKTMACGIHPAVGAVTQLRAWQLHMLSRKKSEKSAGRQSTDIPESVSGVRRSFEVADMRESKIERALVNAVKKQGGVAFKFTSQTMNGVPDRLVLLPGGQIGFVELKAPGKQLRLLQKKRKAQLEALGFPVFVVDTPEQIEETIHAIAHGKKRGDVP